MASVKRNPGSILKGLSALLFSVLSLLAGSVQSATVIKTANASTYNLGDSVTWTLVVQPGVAPSAVTFQDGLTGGISGTWVSQSAGWGGGAWTSDPTNGFYYGPGSSQTAGQDYPQLVTSGVTIGPNAEYLYQTMIPTYASGGDDDSVFIFRNVNCQTNYRIRLDAYTLGGSCPGFAILSYDTSAPAGAACSQTTATLGDGGTLGSTYAEVQPCYTYNSWWNVRILVCNGILYAKAWPVGTNEPAGWQLTNSGATAQLQTSTGGVGFQMDNSHSYFRNLTVYSIGSENNVVVTDPFPGCLTGLTSSCGSFSGNTFTW